MSRLVALVVVSHSADVASGTVQIAAQMAPDVDLHAAGGADGGIGTSVDLVLAAVEAGLAACDRDGGGVVVLTDLGSAVLTTDLVLELLDPDDAALVRVPHAPVVEGAVTAAVAAQQGLGLDAVAAAAVQAGAAPVDDGPAAAPSGSAPVAPGAVTVDVVLRNPLGLHARPAALVARTVVDTGVDVTIDGADGASVLALMTLGVVGGQSVRVAAAGPGARAAVETVAAVIAEGFGEA